MIVKVRPTKRMTARQIHSPKGIADTNRIEPNPTNQPDPYIQDVDISHSESRKWLYGLRDEGQLDIDDGTWGLDRMSKSELVVKADENGLKWNTGYWKKTRVDDLRAELRDHILKSSGEESIAKSNPE